MKTALEQITPWSKGLTLWQIDCAIAEAIENGQENLVRRPKHCPKILCSDCKKLKEISCDADGGITMFCYQEKK